MCRWPITRKVSTTEVLAAFGIEGAPAPTLELGGDVRPGQDPEGEVTIAIVGKYTGLKDAYKSLIEALTMAASPTG
jgi:CTP synthase